MMEKYFLGKFKKGVDEVLRNMLQNQPFLGTYDVRKDKDAYKQVTFGEGSSIGFDTPIPKSFIIVVGRNSRVSHLRINSAVVHGSLTIGDNCDIEALTLNRLTAGPGATMTVEIGDDCVMGESGIFTVTDIGHVKIGNGCRMLQTRLHPRDSLTIGDRVYMHNVQLAQFDARMTIGSDNFIGCSRFFPDGVDGLAGRMDWSNLGCFGNIGSRNFLLCGDSSSLDGVGDDVTMVEMGKNCFPGTVLYDGAVLASTHTGYAPERVRKQRLTVGRNAIAVLNNVYYNDSVTVHPGATVAL